MSIIFTDGRSAALIWALHGYFVPTTKIIKKDVTGKKATAKFTIKDAQESVIFVGASLQEIEDRIHHLQRAKSSIQPSVYCVGDSIFSFNDIFIKFDNYRFTFKNILRALDICFKIIYLFDLEFPLESVMFFNFVETYFYKFQPTKKYPKVQILIEYLSNVHYTDKVFSV